MKIRARYPGTCEACGGPIEAGEDIEWARTERPRHVRCLEPSPFIDADGQPDSRFNRERRIQRTVTELLGLCKGVLLDGVVTDGEMVALDEWLAAHVEIAQDWPADVLYDRLRRAFDDGAIDEDERAHFKGLLEQLVGPADGARLVDAATRLPLDVPPPVVEFPERAFCFTGHFVWGPRPKLVQAVEERGGTCHKAPRKDTDYLVIGTVASRDWAEPSFGRKIERVVAGRAKGWKTRIVGEEYWVEGLGA
jgi:hypothetical protein